MIVYDSHSLRSLLGYKGSVFPRAIRIGGFVAAVSGTLKYLEEHDIVLVPEGSMLRNSSVYGGFTSTLGFFLIFRSSQCYARFCICSSAMCTMRAQFVEAASSLTTFTRMSKAPKETIVLFNNKIIRLFSMLHAFILAAIADQKDENFPIIDIEGVSGKHLQVLAKLNSTERVDMVYQWINNLIVKSLENGILNVPPPILGRVFQEMEKGFVKYNQISELLMIPFPFPYAQVTFVLLLVFMCMSPIVMVLWTNHWVYAFFFTFISVVCFVSIELIASELEMPLGDDDNDLPCMRFQTALNDGLVMLLAPESWDIPDLLPTALLDYNELKDFASRKSASFNQIAEKMFEGSGENLLQDSN